MWITHKEASNLQLNVNVFIVHPVSPEPQHKRISRVYHRDVWTNTKLPERKKNRELESLEAGGKISKFAATASACQTSATTHIWHKKHESISRISREIDSIDFSLDLMKTLHNWRQPAREREMADNHNGKFDFDSLNHVHTLHMREK